MTALEPLGAARWLRYLLIIATGNTATWPPLSSRVAGPVIASRASLSISDIFLLRCKFRFSNLLCCRLRYDAIHWLETEIFRKVGKTNLE